MAIFHKLQTFIQISHFQNPCPSQYFEVALFFGLWTQDNVFGIQIIQPSRFWEQQRGGGLIQTTPAGADKVKHPLEPSRTHLKPFNAYFSTKSTCIVMKLEI